MLRFSCTVVALLLFTRSLALAQAVKPEAACDATASIKQISADLREARTLLPKVPDKTTRERLELLLTRAELRATEIEKVLAKVPNATGPSPISADDFAKLLAAVKKESFDDGKLRFLYRLVEKQRFTCDQARELLKVFSFDESRSKAAEVLYPRLTDPERFLFIVDVFTFDSSRDALLKKLKVK
jgi:hypothetical protein